MLCINAGHLRPQAGDFSAPFEKRVLFGIALVGVLHDIEHLFVLQ